MEDEENVGLQIQHSHQEEGAPVNAGMKVMRVRDQIQILSCHIVPMTSVVDNHEILSAQVRFQRVEIGSQCRFWLLAGDGQHFVNVARPPME